MIDQSEFQKGADAKLKEKLKNTNEDGHGGTEGVQLTSRTRKEERRARQKAEK